MKKALLITFAIVAMLLLAVGLFLGTIVSRGVTAAVNRQGPQLTGTTVTLGSAVISPYSGKGTLNDFVVGNPQGYAAKDALSVEKMHLDLDPMSLLGEPIVIQEMEIVKPKFDFETNLFTSNLKTILENIEKAVGKPAPTDEKGKAPKKIIIEHFLLEDALVTVTVAGRQLQVPVAKLELHDIGKNRGGATPAEAAKEITQQVIAAVVQSASKAVAENPASLKDQATEAGKKVGEAAKDLWDKVKGK